MGRDRRLDYAAVEADWHSDLTSVAVGAKHGADPTFISKIWAAARAAGRLPNIRRPMHFAGAPPAATRPSALLATVADTDDLAGNEAAIDRSERALRKRGFDTDDGLVRIPDCDPLLAALAREHGNDPRRSSDDTLVSDRKVPTPAGLVGRLARIRDLETRQGVVA